MGLAVATMFLPHVAMYPPASYYRSPEQIRQGKVAELRLELNSGGKKDKNIALKKVVANMTMSNNDMVALFPDIVACMQIASLEIKKMCVAEPIPWEITAEDYRCFLYLVHYARLKPEIAVKAVPILINVWDPLSHSGSKR